jgi:hypothetical protein
MRVRKRSFVAVAAEVAEVEDEMAKRVRVQMRQPQLKHWMRAQIVMAQPINAVDVVEHAVRA